MKKHVKLENIHYVLYGAGGIVLDVKVFNREEGDDTLSPGVNQLVRVYVQKRKIHVGDKMCGRHGNKGVISKIVPEEDMPYLPDDMPMRYHVKPSWCYRLVLNIDKY